jgi:hypothetical protein
LNCRRSRSIAPSLDALGATLALVLP